MTNSFNHSLAGNCLPSERADCRKLDWPIAAESFRPGRPRRALWPIADSLDPSKNPKAAKHLKIPLNAPDSSVFASAAMARSGDDAEAVDLETFELEDCSKGHRQLDDIWEHFKKIRLTAEQHQKWHRWWNGKCKCCGTVVDGKPKLLKKHLASCKKASISTQPEALAAQEQSGGTDCQDTESEA